MFAGARGIGASRYCNVLYTTVLRGRVVYASLVVEVLLRFVSLGAGHNAAQLIPTEMSNSPTA